ncbi:MAG: hypothetical protein U0235_11945 [Polyangiaceae bacterium]
MQIEVQGIAGEVSPARRGLATRIVEESFGWLSDVILGVVVQVPAGAATVDARRASSVVVVLRDGRRFDAVAVEDPVADAIERACHDLRREVAREVGRPLRRRRGGAGELGVEPEGLERRAAR